MGGPWLAALVVVAGILLTSAIALEGRPPKHPKPHPWLADNEVMMPLGEARITRYTHNEGGRTTSSGYILQDKDEGKVCAASRDWWRKVIHPLDKVYVEGFPEPCVALDTMADANRKGFKQRKWIDIYMTDVDKALDFGIQKRRTWLIRRKG